MMPRVPQRGDVVWIDFDPQSGHEQAGRRPAIVLSDVKYNRMVGLILICPITSKIKNFSFEVAIPNGLPVHGVVLSDQIKSFDWRTRKAEFLCALPTETVAEVLRKALTLLNP